MFHRSTVLIAAVWIVALPFLASCGSKTEIPPPSPVTGESEAIGRETDTGATSGGVPEESTQSPADAYEFVNVYFEFDKHRLTSEAQSLLTAHAGMLIEHPGWTLRIEGHCDERGTVEYNLALGENRAGAVLSFLTSYGVDSSRIRTVSYGKERPVDMGHTESAWALNRRCEFHVNR